MTKFKVITIYAAALILMAIPLKALAFEYDVDMPNSGDPRYEMVRIIIDECTSKFLIPKKDFEKLRGNKEALKNMVKKSIARANAGCPK